MRTRILLTVGAIAVVAVFAVCVPAEAKPAQDIAPRACSESSWDLTLVYQGTATTAYAMSLTKCQTTLSGSAAYLAECTATVSGSLVKAALDMTWTWQCGNGEVTDFTGKLHMRRGTGSGTWTDNELSGTGSWTAHRTA